MYARRVWLVPHPDQHHLLASYQRVDRDGHRPYGTSSIAVGRAQRDGHKGWDAWVVGRTERWRGIVYSDVIIASGFANFALSSFPPTQASPHRSRWNGYRYLANLFLLPLLGGAEREMRSRPAS